MVVKKHTKRNIKKLRGGTLNKDVNQDVNQNDFDQLEIFKKYLKRKNINILIIDYDSIIDQDKGESKDNPIFNKTSLETNTNHKKEHSNFLLDLKKLLNNANFALFNTQLIDKLKLNLILLTNDSKLYNKPGLMQKTFKRHIKSDTELLKNLYKYFKPKNNCPIDFTKKNNIFYISNNEILVENAIFTNTNNTPSISIRTNSQSKSNEGIYTPYPPLTRTNTGTESPEESPEEPTYNPVGETFTDVAGFLVPNNKSTTHNQLYQNYPPVSPVSHKPFYENYPSESPIP